MAKVYSIIWNRVLAKLGSAALAPPLDEAKAIVSDEFCKISNRDTIVFGKFPRLLLYQ